MSEMHSPEISSDDKLWSALAYVFAPLVGIIVLLMEEKKARPFIKFHAVQSIAASVLFFIVAFVLSLFTFGVGGVCVSFLWLVFLYWAYKAYQGEYVQIPWLSDFIRSQGWA